MIADKEDKRTLLEFVLQEMVYKGKYEGNQWELTLNYYSVDDVKAEPDAERDERYSYDGAADDFEDTMREREGAAFVLDIPLMENATDIYVYPETHRFEIDILY